MTISKTTKTATRKTAALMQRYRKDTRGQFSIMFGVSLMTLLATVATAVDLSSAFFAKQRLQDTTDQIALYAAKTGETDQGKLSQMAQDYMDTNYPTAAGRTRNNSKIVINSVTRTGETVYVNASNAIKTDFAHLIGFPTVGVRVDSSATYAERSIDIAFVLDSTGSMSGAKMTALKSSASELVKTLDGYKSAQVRASVVPFSNYVNVGTGNRNASWLQLPKEGQITGTPRCEMRSDVISQSNCRKVKSTCDNDGVKSTCYKTVCDVKRGPEYEVCFTPEWTAKWEGCVGSRDVPLNTKAAYAGDKIPGLPGKICGTEMRPLTKNLNNVQSTIKALDAKGNTYMPSGLAWGWRTLTPEAPLTEAASGTKKNTQKVLILMTDGDNTRSKNGDWHEGNDGAKADATTKTLCNNIKDDEIQVYSIAYDIADASTRSLVAGCATSPGMAFEAKNAQDLKAAFEKIGQSLSVLRLTN